ncbi:hypothetical protein [Shouchella shacheensis]|uniref:hypothetical protein n=1 Tax=Shouchella shacheensis TaxID=1649580 RepID=UPI0007404BB9|nr:hypothetical protein [Shouchella shacheensis]
MDQKELHTYLEEKLMMAKTQFERTIDCKHTEFDDLYPYMTEQPQFFWYKRYVAWQELLTLVTVAKDSSFAWEELFSKKQRNYIVSRVLDAKVLDNWYEEQKAESK